MLLSKYWRNSWLSAWYPGVYFHMILQCWTRERLTPKPGSGIFLFEIQGESVDFGDVGRYWKPMASSWLLEPAPACFNSWELKSTSCRKTELESIVHLSFCLKIWPFFPLSVFMFSICCRTSLVGQSSSENNSVTRGQVQVGHQCRKHLWAQCHPFLHGHAAVSPVPAAGPGLELPANSSSAACEV